MGSGSSIEKKLKGKDPAFLYADYVVEIDTLLDIKQGWKISCPFPQCQAEETINGFVLSVMSLDNNLKANFVNRFCGYPALSDTINLNVLDKLRGLKVRLTKKIINKKEKVPKEQNRLVCLFAASQENAIYYTENEMMMKFFNKKNELIGGQTDEKMDHLDAKSYEDLKLMIMNDKVITERFIDEYILDTCQCIVILVKDFKFREQKYVEDILQRYRNKKKIFIIHNLIEEVSILGVKQYIELRLKSLFSVKEVYLDPTKWFKPQEIVDNFINKSIFVNDDFNDHVSLINEDEKLRVVHLVIAKEGSIAGKSYNLMAYKFMESFLIPSIGSKWSYNLVSSFKTFLNNKFSNYLIISKRPTENMHEIQASIQKKANFLFLTPEIKHKIKMNYFKTLNFTVLNDALPLQKEDYIPYQVVEKENLYEVYLDIPFLLKNTMTVNLNQQEPDFQYLIVTGTKSKNAHKDIELNNISVDMINEILAEQGTIQFGPFEMKIPIASHDIRLKKKIKCQYLSGILSLILLKSSKSYAKINVNFLEKENLSKDILGVSGSEKINSSFKNLMKKLDEEEEEEEKEKGPNLEKDSKIIGENKFDEINNSNIKSQKNNEERNSVIAEENNNFQFSY